MERRIVGSKPIPYQVAKEYLGARVREGDIISIQESTWEYFKKVISWDDPEAAARLVEEIVREGVSPEAAVNIASLCPKSEGELRAILQMDRSISSVYETASKIYPVISKYCSENE